MTAVGDIVRVTRWPGLWAVTSQMPSASSSRRWRLAQWNGIDLSPTGLDRGEGDLTFMGHPVFTPGQIVNHWGRPVTVVADEGATIRCYIERRKQLEGGGFINGSGETPLDRGALVAENATRLLKLLEIT